MRGAPGSLQGQLVLRLAAVFAVATLLAMGAVIYEGGRVARALSGEGLARRAHQLARQVTRSADGSMSFELSPKLQRLYDTPARTRLFAVRTLDGRLIAASDREFADETGRPERAVAGSFRLEDFGIVRQDYLGLTVRESAGTEPIWVSVASVSDAQALSRDLSEAFIRDVGLAVPLFAAGTLAIAVLSVRRGLRPVLAASEKARSIGPGTTGVRLPTRNLPAELIPLVAAVNAALDRLERGFSIQRQFTANAAHELRTPLAILTAGLDELPDSSANAQLKGDVERMNRLVMQLLSVARLDSVSIDMKDALDLRTVAEEVVGSLAPWTVAQRTTLSLDVPPAPVSIRGNADAIADALRNLVENAVRHTREGGEVSVSVAPEGEIQVADQGRGVDPADRARIFERFWRGPGSRGPGAGLGLSIVEEIVKAHRGSIRVLDAPGGGALFAMRFQLKASR